MKPKKISRRIKPLSFADSPFGGDTVSQITKFFNDNYQIKVNKYNNADIILKSLSKVYKYPVTFDDICLHMIESGVPYKRNVLKMIFNSPNQLETYDPINEYFNFVSNIDIKESHIEKLLSHIHAHEFSNRPTGYYADRTARYLRKWLVGTVACALGKYAHEEALIFVSDRGGNGKTSLAKWLCPYNLTGMLTQSSRDRRLFNPAAEMVNKFIILYDEMYGLDNSIAEQFKQYMSSSQISVRFSNDTLPHNRKRIASVIGTTNNLTGAKRGFLTPALGMRRFICIEIDSIDFSYVDDVDIDMVWAEAYALYKSGKFDYTLSQDDYEELEEENRRYMIETPAEFLIQQLWCIPDGEDVDNEEWLTATDVVARLRDAKLIKSNLLTKINAFHVGSALQASGFFRKMKYANGSRLYMYHLQKLINHV